MWAKIVQNFVARQKEIETDEHSTQKKKHNLLCESREKNREQKINTINNRILFKIAWNWPTECRLRWQCVNQVRPQHNAKCSNFNIFISFKWAYSIRYLQCDCYFLLRLWARNACERRKKSWIKNGLVTNKQWHAAQFSFHVLWIGSSLNNPNRPLNWLKLIHGQFVKNKSAFITSFWSSFFSHKIVVTHVTPTHAAESRRTENGG